jgi:hypothetical protein
MNGLPLSLIEDRRLHMLCHTVPTRQTFTQEVTDFAGRTRELLKARLAQCTSLSIQFDGWTAPHHKGRFIGVMCTGILHDEFLVQNLGTIPVTEQKCGDKYIAGKVEGLLQEYDIAPMVCATDTEAAETSALRHLNEMRAAAQKPQIAWFPCVCHLINLVLQAFATAGAKLFAPLKNLETSLGRSSSFT